MSCFPIQDGVGWEEVGFPASEEGTLHSHSFKSPSSPLVFARFGVAGDGTGGVMWVPQCAELMGET